MSVLEGKTLLKEMEMLKKVEQDEVDLKKNKKNVFIIPCFTIFLVFITTKFNLITTFLNKFDPFEGSSQVLFDNYRWRVNHSKYEYRYMTSWESFKSNEWFINLFRNYWTVSVVFAGLYYYGIFYLQRQMESRQPYNLKEYLILWNSFLGIFSILGVIRVGEEYLSLLYNEGTYFTVCRMFNPAGPTLFWSCLFALSKIFELGDTVFLILRKKPVIFLHYFHHMYVMIIAFNSVAELGAPTQSFMFMNYVAHSIMYPYYAVAAAGFRPPRLISVSITSIQIAQMFAGLFITSYASYVRDIQGTPCQQTTFSTLLSYIGYISFVILFVKFFADSYIKNKKKRQ